MFRILSNWIDRYFSNEEAVVLALLLTVGFCIILFFGQLLMPALIALVLSYLLQSSVTRLEKWKVPHIAAVSMVVTISLAAFIWGVIALLPLLWNQVIGFAVDVPRIVTQWETFVWQLVEKNPGVVDEYWVSQGFQYAQESLGHAGQWALSASLNQLGSLFTLGIFTILVPVLLFFFLRDKAYFAASFKRVLPAKRKLLREVWFEMNGQIKKYIQGKAIEILIVGVATYVAFLALGLQYALLLAVLTGLSVIIPYVGAVAVTIPIVIVALSQFGMGSSFWVVLLVHLGIQGVDGNVIVPWLFSEALNLHPVSIIIAILMFGGLWGFWGVFFAIPLATLLKAVATAWPQPEIYEQDFDPTQ